MATIFVSPGVYTKEQDFSVFASRIGITRLGLVGKTEKGPAFEAIKITSADEYALRFGNTSPDLPLSYVASAFLAQSNELTISRVLGKSGFTNSPAWLIKVSDSSPYPYSGATLAVLRSKQTSAGVKYFDESTDVVIGVSGMTNILSDFTLSATTGPLTAYTNSGFTVSLDETKENYIVKALGKNPKVVEGAINLYVEEIYPHFCREAVSRGLVTGVLNSSLDYRDTDASYTDYTGDYNHSTTPWIVSRVIGGQTHRLFKFHTISDGDASAKEIKISIANIDVNTYTFDVIVRRFDDTDATMGTTAYERFSNVTMDESESNFIGKVIGTWDEEYPSKSLFITVELASRYPDDTVPAGFEGYTLRSAAGTNGATVGIFYKTTYLSGDSIYKTYLGISELGYTGLTSNVIGTKNSVKSIESDIFVYNGETTTGTTTTKGFHMENTADSTYFVSGEKTSLTAYTNAAGTLVDKAKLKFTVVPAGGFDGFNKYKTYTYPYEEFIESTEQNNYEQFKLACDVFENPEEVDINLFATPGVDLSNNASLVRYALAMIEDRADTLYVIDSPRITTTDSQGTTTKGTPEEVVNVLETSGIDSNYAATYWPWVQIEDTISGKYTYQPPTLLVVKALALTDNVAAPWFAPAGLNRGVAGTSIKRTDIKLSKLNRDTLYEGRVNPIASFVQQGIVIWGQKTLQVRQSSLDRINIRRLLLQVRRLISAAALTLLFEQNDQTLRDQFLSKVEPILLQIQNQRGLTAFKVVMDDSNNTSETIDRNTLVGKIQLKPTPTAEFIDLTFQVLPQGASFEDF